MASNWGELGGGEERGGGAETGLRLFAPRSGLPEFEADRGRAENGRPTPTAGN